MALAVLLRERQFGNLLVTLCKYEHKKNKTQADEKRERERDWWMNRQRGEQIETDKSAAEQTDRRTDG
jgi:hypothetical protein